MSEDVKNNLKLIGKNQEDLKVISAYSQDSIVATKDMIFLKKNRNKRLECLAIKCNEILNKNYKIIFFSQVVA